MKKSTEYAREAFLAAENGEKYFFPSECFFEHGESMTLCKDRHGYILDFINPEFEAEPIEIKSETDLADVLRTLIPCSEDSLENKEFDWNWSRNVEERDKEDIMYKFLEKLRYPDGHEYNWEWNEFYEDIRVNGRTYACKVYCEIAPTGYWYYGDIISIKRVR